MKKIFSISLAILILLSGMHLSVSTHVCGGEIAAVKWSFTGKNATCGMEDLNQTNPNHKSFTSNCCQNEIAVYSVDNNYCPSFCHNIEITTHLLQVFYVPVNFTSNSITVTNSLSENVLPPGNLLTNMVSLTDICVFRI